jgi:hypothetical protein
VFYKAVPAQYVSNPVGLPSSYCVKNIPSLLRIAMAKAAFNKKKTLLTSKLGLELRKKLVKCYIWSIALYGAETWTLRKLDRNYMESFEMWCWRRMEKISWTDRVNNEAQYIYIYSYICTGILPGNISYNMCN